MKTKLKKMRLHPLAQHIFRTTFIALALLNFSGCASYFLKKDCEKVDWHKHGYDLAMQGKRVTGDSRVNDCRKVDRISDSQLDLGFKAGMANYCKPEIVYSTGRSGEFFNSELCDPGMMGTLQSRHAQGVREYCAVSNGFTAGAKGKPYNNICPTNMVEAFLKEFNKGRKKYLQTMVAENQTRISQLDDKLLQLQRERNQTHYQLMALPQPEKVQTTTYNNALGKHETTWSTVDHYQSQRNHLQSKIQNHDLELSSTRKTKEELQNQILTFEREIATFPDK